MTKYMISALTMSILICQLALGQNKSFHFKNGSVFNGYNFQLTDFYTQNGIITFQKPISIDSIVDLDGGYVIPPYGEAHNHNIEYSAKIESIINGYLKSGIFYVKNPCNHVIKIDILRKLVNVNTSIDVMFSNMGFTSLDGHPSLIAKGLVDRGITKEVGGTNGFIFEINSEQDLEEAWIAYLSTKPDFVKVFLLMSENTSQVPSPLNKGNHGLKPNLLQLLVDRAHTAGLRVSAHVESAYDFHLAVLAGVDEINHLPGFRGDPGNQNNINDLSIFKISEDDAKLASKKGISIVTTLSGISEMPKKHSLRKYGEELFKYNLNNLIKNNVDVAIGSDAYDHTSLLEVFYLEELNIFTNLELVKILCENTVKTIFPDRKLGSIDEGFEANFLVLNGNPLENIQNLSKIALRVKGGEILILNE